MTAAAAELTSDAARPSSLIRCGADLVELAEQLHLRLFRLILGFLLAAAGLTTIFTSLNGTAKPEVSIPVSIGFALAAIGSVRSSRRTYLWLRHGRARQMLPGFVAATLMLIGPYGPFWFLSMALLGVTAVVGSRRQTLATAALAGGAYVAGTVVAGNDLFPGGDVRYAGAAFGLFVNGLLVSAVVEWFGGFVLKLHRLEQETRLPPPTAARVASIRTEPPVEPQIRRAPSRPVAARTRGPLTPRQLQVVLLLRDGLKHAEVAASLGISERQVGRLIQEARERADARTTAQLVALVVELGLIAPPEGLQNA